MKPITAVLALLLCMQKTAAQETQEFPEINPPEFLPLEVGNSWTFRHSFRSQFWWSEEERLDQWASETCGNEEEWCQDYIDQMPPFQSERNETIVTIEIIGAIEGSYGTFFVFSKPPYEWPPMPRMFFAGRAVRWSEDGKLVFLTEFGDSVVLYDFNSHSTAPLFYEYTVFPPSAFDYIPFFSQSDILINRSYGGIPKYLPQKVDYRTTLNPKYEVAEVEFEFMNPAYSAYYPEWRIDFVRGYGLGFCHNSEIEEIALEAAYANILYPVSAILSGQEVSYEEATEKLVTFVEPEPIPAVAQLDTFSTGYLFDFSEGGRAGSYDVGKDTFDVELVQVWDGHSNSGNPPVFVSTYGVADLGTVDFARSISNGTADLEPDTSREDGKWVTRPQKDHVYALWTREGGIALVHVVDKVFHPNRGYLVYMIVDWKYFPPSTDDRPTSVKPISWGRLKDFPR